MDILVDNKPIKGRNRRKSKTKGSHPDQYRRAAKSTRAKGSFTTSKFCLP